MIKLCVLFFVLSSFIYGQINLEIDEKAPEIIITNWIKNVPENKNIKGKFRLIDFWATWCGPCLKSVPHLNELKSKFEEITFLSISDEKVEKIDKTLAKINFQTIVVSDTSKLTFQNYKSLEYDDVLRPSVILIDDNDIIKWVGYPNLLNEKILKSFLSKTLKPYNYFTTSQFKKDLNEKNNSGNIIELKTKFLYEINDPNLNDFIFVEKSNSLYGKSGFEDSDNKFMLYGFKDFKYLYSKVTNKPSNEFIVDDKIEKENYDFCMIYKTNNRKNLDSLFLQKLKLKKEILLKEVDFYDLNIDFKKLGFGKPEEFQPKFIEDDENSELKYSNYSINELILDLNNKFNLTISTKTNFNKIYNFTILTKNKAEIFKSLENYGFSFLIFKRKIEIFKIEKI